MYFQAFLDEVIRDRRVRGVKAKGEVTDAAANYIYESCGKGWR